MRLPAHMLAPVLNTVALVLLGAHELRFGGLGLAAACVLLVVLAWTRFAWVRWVLLAVLALALGVWLESTLEIVRWRMEFGMSWSRLAGIMSGVGALTLAAFTVTLTGPGERRYAVERDKGIYRAVIFCLTCGLLLIASAKVSFPILLLERFAPGWAGVEVFGLGYYAQWLGGKMLDPKASRRIRPRIWALFTIVFFGQLMFGLLGAEKLLMTGTLHLPLPALIVGGPVFRGGGLFMVILYSVTLLLVGPAWCSHLCYVGAWDDQMARLGPQRPDQSVPGRFAWWGRGAALVLTVALALGLRFMGIPGLTATWIAAGFGLLGVGVMVLFSRKAGIMVHCTAYCPIGLVGNVLGKLLPWRIRLGKECTQCGVCATVCRYGALTERDIVSGKPGLTCTLCGDCVGACPHKTMGYRFPGLDAATARRVFLVLVVTLHAVFLGVARI